MLVIIKILETMRNRYQSVAQFVLCLMQLTITRPVLYIKVVDVKKVGQNNIWVLDMLKNIAEMVLP